MRPPVRGTSRPPADELPGGVKGRSAVGSRTLPPGVEGLVERGTPAAGLGLEDPPADAPFALAYRHFPTVVQIHDYPVDHQSPWEGSLPEHGALPDDRGLPIHSVDLFRAKLEHACSGRRALTLLLRQLVVGNKQPQSVTTPFSA